MKFLDTLRKGRFRSLAGFVMSVRGVVFISPMLDFCILYCLGVRVYYRLSDIGRPYLRSTGVNFYI